MKNGETRCRYQIIIQTSAMEFNPDDVSYRSEKFVGEMCVLGQDVSSQVKVLTGGERDETQLWPKSLFNESARVCSTAAKSLQQFVSTWRLPVQ